MTHRPEQIDSTRDAPPLRILHVASHEGVYRGGAVQLCRMAERQARRGHEVWVVAHVHKRRRSADRRRHRETWSRLAENGVQVRFLKLERRLGLLKLWSFLRTIRPDIVHAHRDTALLAAHKVLRGAPRPALIAQRGTVTPPPPEVARVLALPAVKAVVAVCHAVREELGQRLDVQAKQKIHVVYGSLDLNEFSPRAKDAGLLKRLAIEPDAKVIGSISAYRKAKGLESLATAVGDIAHRRQNIRGVFIGNGLERELAPRLKDIPGRDRITILDHQPDVARWLSIMDLTIVAATAREGLSGVLRESLAMERGVIATDHAGNPEIVKHKKTGLLVPPGDKSAMRAAIDWALDHPEEMNVMAKAGRRWVEEQCSTEKQGEELEKIYRGALREI